MISRHFAHTDLAHRAEPVEKGASDQHALGAERTRFQHVLTAAHAAVHPDLDAAADRFGNRRQGRDRTRRAVELTPAMVADDQRIGAGVGGEARVLGVHDPFQDQRAAPALLDPLDVAPIQPRVELLGGPAAQRAHVLHALDVADDVAELASLRAQHVPAPARLECEVDQILEGRFRRRRQPVLQVLVALPEDLQIQRQHQRRAARGLRAVDQPFDEVAIAHHVELEPERLRGRRCDVLDRADAHRRQRERHAERFGGARREDLAVGVLHAGQAGRRERHGHRYRLAGHRRADRATVHVDGDALAQLQLREVRFVGAIGALGPRARVAIVVEHPRDALLRQRAQVFDIGDHDRHQEPPCRPRCYCPARRRGIVRGTGRSRSAVASRGEVELRCDRADRAHHAHTPAR